MSSPSGDVTGCLREAVLEEDDDEEDAAGFSSTISSSDEPEPCVPRCAICLDERRIQAFHTTNFFMRKGASLALLPRDLRRTARSCAFRTDCGTARGLGDSVAISEAEEGVMRGRGTEECRGERDTIASSSCEVDVLSASSSEEEDGGTSSATMIGGAEPPLDR